MDSSSEQRSAIGKSIIELMHPSESFGFVENRSMRSNRFGDDVVVFYDKDLSVTFQVAITILYTPSRA